MIKKLLLGSISVFFSLSMIACGSYDKPTHLEEKITVYTTYSEDIMDSISNTFNEETGVKVEYKIIHGDIKESIENDTNVDFVLGGDIATYKDLSKKGLLKEYKTSWFSEMNECDRGENGEWYAVSKEMILLIYNNVNLLPQNAPKSWEQLAEPMYKNKIVIESTDNEYIRLILSSIMYKYYKNNDENTGIKYYQGLKNNISTIVESKENLFEALANKETPIGVSTLSDYIKYSQSEGNIAVIKVAEGIPIITQGAAVLKNSSNPNASELFMEFVAGPRIQFELAKNNNIIPTHPDVIKYGAEWMKSLAELTPMDINWETIQEKKVEWINIFNNLEKETLQPETTIKNKTNTTKKTTLEQATENYDVSGEENDTPAE